MLRLRGRSRSLLLSQTNRPGDYLTMNVNGLVAPMRFGMFGSPSSPPWLGMVTVCVPAGAACVDVKPVMLNSPWPRPGVVFFRAANGRRAPSPPAAR